MPCKRITRFGGILLLGLILYWPAMALFAQNDAEVTTQEQDQQTESEAAGDESHKTDQRSGEQSKTVPIDLDSTPDRFMPSEDVSEDLSVPFPTDI